jgi:hypothetical protein
MKRIVLFVEGQGDVKAVPVLIRRLITDQDVWNILSIDENPFEIRSVNNIVKENYSGWKNKLKSCLSRKNIGGVLVILDGDIKKVSGKDFCAAEVAKSLADAAKEVGAGKIFSVAIVFAVQEYETWLVAGIESLAGKKLPDGRTVNARAKAPDGDLEVNPRNAKGALGTIIEGGYDQVLDQAILTQLIDIAFIRSRKLRSFQRLESALSSLIEAIRSGDHIASPS